MRIFILCLLLFPLPLSAISQPKTEAALIGEIFACLQTENQPAYISLFPGMDSLAHWVVQHADKQSASYQKMLHLQNNPIALLEYDSVIREEATENFEAFYARSKRLNVHWPETIFLRFELEEIRVGSGVITEKVAPLSFLGYVFFKDQLTQKIYGFTVFDLMQVNGKWYGGELVDIFEAQTKDQFKKALAADRKRKRLGLPDPELDEHVTTEEEEEMDKPSNLKQVAERRFYRGRFDDEIKVQLYVRYIKGGCPEGICSWEALFKYGDQDEWVRMKVTRTEEGSWLFQEELGSMELELKEEEYTGVYAMSSDKTEYTVHFRQMPISPKKLKLLDGLLELEEEEW